MVIKLLSRNQTFDRKKQKLTKKIIGLFVQKNYYIILLTINEK